MYSWSRLEMIATLSGDVTTKPLQQSRISLWIETPAPSKWVGWWSAPTSYFRSRQPPTGETSTLESMRPMSMERRKALVQAPTWVMLSSALASLLAWGSNHSTPDALNWVETWRWLPSTSVKCTTKWQLHVTFVEHLPAWQHKTFEESARVQREAWQRACRAHDPWSAQEDIEVTRPKKGIKGSQVKENI